MTGFQYVVVRFVPNVVRDEAVNVGVLLRAKNDRSLHLRFLSRNATVRKLWPEADDKIVDSFRKQLTAAIKSKTALGRMGDPRSPSFFETARIEMNGNLQLSGVRGLLSDSVEDALEWAFGTYVALPGGATRPINFQAIAPLMARRRLWDAFERQGLIGPKRIRERVSLQGLHAPWTFDLVYRNGALKTINSLAINAPTAETNLGRALVLKGMVEDVFEKKKELITCTAVVQDLVKGEAAAGAKEAQNLLRDATIEVVPLAELSKLVQKVGEDLSATES
jgi:hypothetical protein